MIYIIPFACFVATYLLGVFIGRKSVLMDMEKKHGKD